MKKPVIALLFLFVAVLAYASEPFFSFGLGVRFSPYSLTENSTETDPYYGSYTRSDNLSMLTTEFGLRIDLYYVRIAAYFGSGVPSYSTADYYSGTTNTFYFIPGENEIVADFDILAKFPFRLGNVVCLWPAVGIGKTVLLAEIKGSQLNAGYDDKMSPLVVKAGVGLDVILGKIVLTSEILFGYNLTPAPVYMSVVSGTFFSFKIDAGLSVGYKF